MPNRFSAINWLMGYLTFVFIRRVYDEMVTKGDIVPKEEVAPPTVPMDFNWARVSTMNLGDDLD